MSYFKKEEIDQFYNIISNLIAREEFDTMVSEDGSRQIGPWLAKEAVVSQMTYEQLEAIANRKWACMFIDGIAHISWQSGVVNNIFSSFFKTHGWERQTKVDEYCETWFTNRYYWWFKKGFDFAIKECYRSPNSFSSSCKSEFTFSFHPISEMPAVPEMIAIAMSQSNGRVWIVDQFCGSKTECDLWADKMTKKNMFVRFVEFDNNKR